MAQLCRIDNSAPTSKDSYTDRLLPNAWKARTDNVLPHALFTPVMDNEDPNRM
jgi:hypothetical protein